MKLFFTRVTNQYTTIELLIKRLSDGENSTPYDLRVEKPKRFFLSIKFWAVLLMSTILLVNLHSPGMLGDGGGFGADVGIITGGVGVSDGGGKGITGGAGVVGGGGEGMIGGAGIAGGGGDGMLGVGGEGMVGGVRVVGGSREGVIGGAGATGGCGVDVGGRIGATVGRSLVGGGLMAGLAIFLPHIIGHMKI